MNSLVLDYFVDIDEVIQTIKQALRHKLHLAPFPRYNTAKSKRTLLYFDIQDRGDCSNLVVRLLLLQLRHRDLTINNFVIVGSRHRQTTDRQADNIPIMTIAELRNAIATFG